MKLILITILTFGFFACNYSTDRKPVGIETAKTTQDSLIQVKAFYIDENEVNSNEYKEYYSCYFDKFIDEPKTPKLAKDIFLDKEWNLANDNEALALLDSLTAKDKSSRPFYFKVVTKTYKKSDGYFSEGLGFVGKEYVEKNTREFVHYFENKECHTNRDLETWADIVMLELGMYGEELETKNIVQDYIKTLKKNLYELKPNEKETINKFCDYLLEKRETIIDEIKSNKQNSNKPNR